MSDSLHDRIVEGLEKTAISSGFPLVINVDKPNDVWLIKFSAGNAAVITMLETFVRNPKIVLDPFLEEVIKRNL